MIDARPGLRSPAVAGIFLGLGLGGFFDGIVLHQVLQWHHLATSAGYPANSVSNLEWNTLLDGLFHAAAWTFTALGIVLLWQAGNQGRTGSSRQLAGWILTGFGTFNLLEGTINHQLLGLHHVNETAPRETWIYWDIGFLAWGAAMIAGGLWLARARGTGR